MSRGLAYLVDLGVITVAGSITAVGLGAVLGLIRNDKLSVVQLSDWAVLTIHIAWLYGYFTIAWALTGRTIGNALAGLRVVRLSGATIGILRSLLRAVILIPTVIIQIPIVALSKQRRGLHDRATGTTVVYDWGAASTMRAIRKQGPGAPVAVPDTGAPVADTDAGLPAAAG